MTSEYLLRKSDQRRSLAAWLLLAAVSGGIYGCYPAATLHYLTHDQTPLDMPVNIREGVLQSPVFTTDQNAYYGIMLHFDQTIQFERLTCITGGSLAKNRECAPSLLDVTWEVFDEEEPIASGRFTSGSDAFYSGHYIRRVIGRFRAQAGHSYLLKLRVNRSVPELDVTKPRLLVLAPTIS